MGLKFVNLSGSGESLLSKDLEEAVAYLSKNKVSSMICQWYRSCSQTL